MRVVLYTRPSFLDAVLSGMPHLADIVDLHVIVELSPDQWCSSLFDIPRKKLSTGFRDAISLLRPYYPSDALVPFQKFSSFNFIVHNRKQSLHPDSLIVNRKVVNYINRLSPDIVHFDDVTLRISLSLYQLRKFCIVMTIHDPIFHIGEKNWRGFLSRLLAFKWIRLFILHNRKQRNEFSSRYRISPKIIKVIPLGIYSVYRNWYNPDISQKPKTVLFFGRLASYKGIETFLHSAQLVASKISGVHFIVAGEKLPSFNIPPSPMLSNRGTFQFITSYISNQKVAKLFQEATIVVCPYHEATQSGVILTAYAFNCPVVVTRTGGLPEYVLDDKSGLIVPPKDATLLANAILSILSDCSKQEKLRMGVQSICATTLNWDLIARQTADLYFHLKQPSFNP